MVFMYLATKIMNTLLAVNHYSDILPQYRNTPISLLFEYHNFKIPFKIYHSAQILVGMCMDNRKYLHIPDNFAYILRSGGGNLRNSEFKVSYAIAVGNISYIALIGHTNCGMVQLVQRKQLFISGLVSYAGWSYLQAEQHFDTFSKQFEIENEIDFTVQESRRIQELYPKVTVVPLLFKVEDSKLYQIVNDEY